MVDERVVSLLSEYTVPIPDAGRDRLTGTLDSHLEETAIVGLGEATHGTRECLELKHRLVEHLVEDHGYRTVAFEVDFARGRALDRFVRRGHGPVTDALGDIRLWVWRTEAIRRFLEWVREFNTGRPTDDRVSVHGISLSTPRTSARELQRCLQGHDDDSPTPVKRLDSFATRVLPDDGTARQSYFEDGRAVAQAMRTHLEDHEPRYVERTSEYTVTVARRLCRHLEQNCAWNQTRLASPDGFDPEGFQQRDRYMAENVGWCLDADPGEGVVVWAHNTHVKRGTFDLSYDWARGATMGDHLHDEFGSRYTPFGMDFAHGRFRAKANTDESAVQTFRVDSPDPDSLTAHLEALGSSRLFLDVAGAREDDQLGSWLSDDRAMRGVSALVAPDPSGRVHDMHTDIAEAFDGIFFLSDTSHSVPLDSSTSGEKTDS